MIVQRGFAFLRECAQLHQSLVSCRGYVKRLSREVEYVKPTNLLVTCMDSRIDPTRYIEMVPGSTFIIRNPGNFIPHAEDLPAGHVSTALAGLELTTGMESITDITVCGHADCKAIHGLRSLKQCCTKDMNLKGPLNSWLTSRGERTWYKYLTEQEERGFMTVYNNVSKEQLLAKLDPEKQLCTYDRISQINVLQQLENVASHDFMKAALARGIQLHGMWLDLKYQMTYIFDWELLKFVEVKSKESAGAYAQMADSRWQFTKGLTRATITTI